ncbi:hypothetical protein HO173_011935 [Letharia columbiana]|uniref:Uncharacterized protein n=1 Tax=Letharia columbiana TaxID=112416 RepID=A0A8H6CQQ3_9LECA|nr:uncharacterized protein HO173_011935 [Letharia columbiana]KAF6227833.1 hypothetical protein HO173_011935 [Letharia columbiana]
MDYLQDLFPQAARFYNDYYYPFQTYLVPLYRILLSSQLFFYRRIYPTLYPIYVLSNNALHSLSTDAPDILTLAILAIALIISLRVLDYMRRTIMYWVGLAIKMGLWLAVGGLGVYVWQRGFNQSVEDFGYVWGFLHGLGNEGERIGGQKARGRERDARRMAGAGKRGRTRGAGW